MEQLSIEANGLEFAALADGPADGPLALCLHGFPDTAYTWRHLLPDLAAAGYRAVAPFMRGYAPTAIPADGRYQTGALARDANELHQALGGSADAVLIGHDWGAAATYGAIAHQPERWRKAVTASVPPLGSVAESFLTYSQLHRSWYMFFFQSPLAEIALPVDDWVFLDRLWADWSPGYDAAVDVAHVKDAIATPERIEAAIGYYRAQFDPSRHHPELAAEQAATTAMPSVPVLYLHGVDDGCFALEAIGDPLAHLPASSELSVIERAGHFVTLENPEQVNARILSFLSD